MSVTGGLAAGFAAAEQASPLRLYAPGLASPLSSATTSACRLQPVFSSTARKWIRTVLGETLQLPALSAERDRDDVAFGRMRLCSRAAPANE